MLVVSSSPIVIGRDLLVVGKEKRIACALLILESCRSSKTVCYFFQCVAFRRIQIRDTQHADLAVRIKNAETCPLRMGRVIVLVSKQVSMLRFLSMKIIELLFVYKSASVIYRYATEQYTSVIGGRVSERDYSYCFTVRREHTHAIDGVIVCGRKLGITELYAASTRRDGGKDTLVGILVMD